MKSLEQFKIILTILSTLSIRLEKKDIKAIYSLNEREYEEFLRFGEREEGLGKWNDGKLSFHYQMEAIELEYADQIPLELYADTIYYMICREKLDWSMLEIDRLRKEFDRLSMMPDDVLTITNQIGMHFEEVKDYRKAFEIYLTGSRYCEKNNLQKDIFVECVLQLSKLHFVRFL